MIGDLFRSRSAAAPSTASVPAGLRVYAVGDIHGRADLLSAMADLIDEDRRARPAERFVTVFLGDYMDRGPDSAGVIDRLSRGDFPTPLVALRGNHDAIFLDLLEGRADLAYYEQLGGDATLRSYGIDPWDLAGLGASDQQVALRAAIPAAHVAFFKGTSFALEIGDYFFCHAGVRPGVDLAFQAEEDLIWIREAFLNSTYDFGKVIVHGHTPVKTPQIRSNGINVDTKAFASGRLTALVLEGRERRFLQT